MMVGSPEVARARYNQTMRSSIFEPAEAPAQRGLAPLGKRRDQTTSEMFGSYDDKCLQGAPLTFIPREDYTTARQKKISAMSSEVLPNSGLYHNQPEGRSFDELRAERVLPAPVDYEHDEVVDCSLRRQRELQSKLFGRATPDVDGALPSARKSRMTPTNVAWHSHQEQNKSEDKSHSMRAYEEKCSQVFEHVSPQTLDTHMEAEKRFKEEEKISDAKRRSDAYYSDLFGRPEYREQHSAQSQAGDRRFKHVGHPEDKFVVHQDWADSKTELLSSRAGRPEHPLLRKSDEFNQARIFGPRETAWAASTGKMEPMTHDNSQKLRSAVGRAPGAVHQAHLKSSVASDEFYQTAENNQDWQVTELYISGLKPDADDRYVRNLCQGFDLHIVKATAEVDPVCNRCQGRAKVTVRYNPARDSIEGLVHKFQSTNLKVEV